MPCLRPLVPESQPGMACGTRVLGWSTSAPSDLYPKGPSASLVHTLALKGVLYPYFAAFVCTIQVPGPFFNRGSSVAH